jgi:hypothetical protein
MHRCSTRTLMGFITVCAIGLTVLTSADKVWGPDMALFSLVALSGGLLGALVLRGREQDRCIGFCLFCGAYLVLMIVSIVVIETLGGD